LSSQSSTDLTTDEKSARKSTRVGNRKGKRKKYKRRVRVPLTCEEIRARRLLSYADLRQLGIPFSRVWIHKLVQNGRFPRPLKLAANHDGGVNLWEKAEIDAWIDARVAARDQKAAQQDSEETEAA
jgi:predicted DNA-binding transcriptional regulator AlpA